MSLKSRAPEAELHLLDLYRALLGGDFRHVAGTGPLTKVQSQIGGAAAPARSVYYASGRQDGMEQEAEGRRDGATESADALMDATTARETRSTDGLAWPISNQDQFMPWLVGRAGCS